MLLWFYFVHSADAPEGKRTACYDVELEIVSLVENFFYGSIASKSYIPSFKVYLTFV